MPISWELVEVCWLCVESVSGIILTLLSELLVSLNYVEEGKTVSSSIKYPSAAKLATFLGWDFAPIVPGAINGFPQ